MTRGLGSSSSFFLAAALLTLAFCGSLSAQLPPATFYGRVDSPYQTGGTFLIASDLTGNGTLDLVVGTNTEFPNLGIEVILGNGDGTFQAPVPYTVGYAPQAGQVADFNNDGIPDLVIANYSEGSVAVLLGNGDGTFQSAITTMIGSQSLPYAIAAGDFNGDGNMDLALPVSLPQAGQYGVAILLGNGNGTFSSPTFYNMKGRGRLIEVGDFNNDGKLDLVTANSSDAIAVFLGNGNGTFQAAINGPTMIGASSLLALLVDDFNHDGNADVALGDSLALGKGDGTFQAPTQVIASGNTVTATADFNGDGIPDLLATAPSGPSSGETFIGTVWLGLGNGAFQQSASFSVLGFLAVPGDTTGDGNLDVITGAPVASVTFGNGDGTFQVAPTLPGLGIQSTVIASTTAVDLNGDGKPDLVGVYVTQTLDEQFGGVAAFLGTGSGFSSPILTYLHTNETPFNAAAADFNGDGKQDLAVAAYSVIAILLGNGDGTFQREVDYNGGAEGIQVADFNGDGKPDLIVWEPDPSEFSVLLGNGDGTFGFAQTTNDTNEITSVAAADLNNDGKADAVVGDAGGIAVFIGNGNGTFQAPVYYATTFDKQYVAIGDFNGDGIPDIVFAGGVFNASTGLTTGVVGVLLGNGDGTFQAPLTMDLSLPLLQPVVADLNGDGKLDIAATTETYQTDTAAGVMILLGNGDGTFQPPTKDPGFNGVAGGQLAVADFNADGSLDIAVPSTPISILYGEPAGASVNLSPVALSFGNESVGGKAAAQTVTLTNLGQTALMVSSVTISGAQGGDYSQTNNCGSSVAAKRACVINVTFAPSASGVRTATLLITDSAKSSPQTVFLSGMGVGLGLGIAAGQSGATTVSPGQTASYTFSIGGAGFSGMATLSCTGVPSGATCSLPSSINVSGTQATQFKVSVSTTGQSASAVTPNQFIPFAWQWAVAILGVVIWPAGQGLREKKRWLRLCGGCGLLLAMLFLISSCGGGGSSGGGGGSGGTPAGNYTLTVTATSGSIKESLPLKLTVQ